MDTPLKMIPKMISTRNVPRLHWTGNLFDWSDDECSKLWKRENLRLKMVKVGWKADGKSMTI